MLYSSIIYLLQMTFQIAYVKILLVLLFLIDIVKGSVTVITIVAVESLVEG